MLKGSRAQVLKGSRVQRLTLAQAQGLKSSRAHGLMGSRPPILQCSSGLRRPRARSNRLLGSARLLRVDQACSGNMLSAGPGETRAECLCRRCAPRAQARSQAQGCSEACASMPKKACSSRALVRVCSGRCLLMIALMHAQVWGRALS